MVGSVMIRVLGSLNMLINVGKVLLIICNFDHIINFTMEDHTLHSDQNVTWQSETEHGNDITKHEYGLDVYECR